MQGYASWSVQDLLRPLITVEEWVLEGLHAVGLGWGLAIVGLTVLVRLAILPLTFRQLRAQRQLKTHLPELKRLQERYQGDRKRLHEETFAYYQKHGFNPLSVFTPLLIQIPILVSLYYLLRTDVANGLFGQASFLFIPDLTAKPHGTVLVALVSIYLGAQLSAGLLSTRSLPAGQRRFVLLLPLVFAGFITRFPAGLLLYWITTSIWTLGQQLVFWRAAARSR
jgi:YidC/Oxa1 family membrane protein insertase